MSKELVLQTKDLTDVGISSQLTSNDLLEVVAHDIYDKYLTMVNATIDRGNDLKKEYQQLLNPEINKMKGALSKYFKNGQKVEVVDEDEDGYYDEDEDFKNITASFTYPEGYWPGISMFEIVVKEKERGTFVEKGSRGFSIPSLKLKSAPVKLTLSGSTSVSENAKVGGIRGKIETSVKKQFTQTVTIPISRFKIFAQSVIEHNKEVETIIDFLPKNGALSVERFTREARVKMNKKILSAQSPEFRKKISQLFNIQL